MTTRRAFLRGSALLGCSAAAHPLMTSVTFASAPWDARLVVLILRGGMDGLDVVRPVGDPAFGSLRRQMAEGGQPLDDFYQMHPGLSDLAPLWSAGDLGFVHAVSTPYRNKRSHFDGQDLLEAGTGMDTALPRDGWLNRMLQTVPGVEGETAFSIGRENLRLLTGSAEVANWSPETRFGLSPQAERLLQMIYQDDPLFSAASSEAAVLARDIALDLEEGADGDMMEMMARGRGASEVALAAFAADRLTRDTRIAAFSINGWDTHRNQSRELGRRLGKLAEVILTLKQGLGPVWDRTTILAITEFGRTVRENGTGGTDHGTGGAMLFAGGAVRGGRVLGHWPGVAEADLFDRQDLMPTADVRAYSAWAMRSAFGIDRSALEGSIFPGLDMGDDPHLL